MPAGSPPGLARSPARSSPGWVSSAARTPLGRPSHVPVGHLKLRGQIGPPVRVLQPAEVATFPVQPQDPRSPVTGNKKPDGAWVYPGDLDRSGVVEVTSPPDAELMGGWARAKKAGDGSQSESGSIPVRLNQLAQVCTELLAEAWARENTDKLLAQPADERHLFLFARSHRVGAYFYRLSDSSDDGATEQIDEILLPEGITDVWFRGRARRHEPSNSVDVWVSRFQAGFGWQRYVARIAERHLPPPNPDLVDDRVPADWRRPKDRTK